MRCTVGAGTGCAAIFSRSSLFMRCLRCEASAASYASVMNVCSSSASNSLRYSVCSSSRAKTVRSSAVKLPVIYCSTSSLKDSGFMYFSWCLCIKTLFGNQAGRVKSNFFLWQGKRQQASQQKNTCIITRVKQKITQEIKWQDNMEFYGAFLNNQPPPDFFLSQVLYP